MYISSIKIDQNFELFRERESESFQLPTAQEVIAMRNVLVHDYFGVDLEEIWRVVERDLPELKNKLKKLVGELEKNK